LSELESAEAMREAIRRVRALVRRNGPTFSSSPSIFGRQQRQAAALGPLRWMRTQACDSARGVGVGVGVGAGGRASAAER